MTCRLVLTNTKIAERMGGQRSKRGFVLTLDAVVAVTFFLFAIMIIANQTYLPRAPGGIYLKQLNLDILSVIEKTGRLAQAFDGNTSSVQEVLESTPKLACVGIYATNSSGDTVMLIEKSDCNETTGLDVQVTFRPAVYEGTRYVIKSESWFRKEPD